MSPKGNGLNGRLVLAVATSSLGMFVFGYNVSVINAPQSVIEQFYNKTVFEREGRYISETTLTMLWSLTVSISAIGGMVGGVLAGWMADRLGRKRGMLFTALTGILGALLLSLAKVATSFEMLMIGRFVIGLTSVINLLYKLHGKKPTLRAQPVQRSLGIGLYTGVVPIYNAEVAPTQLRGAIGTINQLACTIGILVAQVLSLKVLLGTETLWPLLLALTAVPVILQAGLFAFSPETPRYLLLVKGDKEAARKALLQLRGQDEMLVDQELEQYRRESQETEQKMTVFQVLAKKSLRSPLLLAVMMQFSQQLTGMNIIFFYSTNLFESAGLSAGVAQYASLAVGGIMTVMTLVSIPLMDVAGRRTLHLAGLAGMALMSIVFTLCYSQSDAFAWLKYLTIGSALMIVVFFAVGPGPVPWLIVAELFSQEPRPGAISISVLCNWLASFTVGLIFLPLQAALKDLVFIPFTVLLVFFCAFLFFKLPETKHKTFDEIAKYFNQPSNASEEFDMDSKETRVALL